jgi:hypothetical protein
MRTLIVINGRPRAGKDTAVRLMREVLAIHDYATEEFSSIDPVRDMLTAAGFDLSRKTPEDRAFLAEVGDAAEKHSRFRTRTCFDRTMALMEGREKAVMFIHMREPVLINRLQVMLSVSRLLPAFITCIVRSNRSETVTSNAADMGVEGMMYNDEIRNDGTIEELGWACEAFLQRQGLIDQIPLLRLADNQPNVEQINQRRST